jgi:SAM-dependent MidA family methyltransferase
VRNEFETTLDNPALKSAIIERIQREGGITFRDYMEMALYHPRFGYYCSPGEKIGRAGDYLTSPEVSPIFGALLGRQLHEMWTAMGKPLRFEVVEVGAGNGTLCADLLRWAVRTAPPFNAALKYTIVEISDILAARQRDVVEAEATGSSVRWAKTLPEVIEGCIVSNELLDAMPVHRVVMDGRRLQEVFVTWDGQQFREELRELSTPEIGTYFDELDLLPGDHCRAEVNLDAFRWMQHAARSLRRGFILTLDYGYEAVELYAPWRTDGTLLCFYRHNPTADPYSRIGRQDMTSHVDFTSVRRFGTESGLRTLGLASQSEFLTNLGITETLSEIGAGLENYQARRRAIVELIDPAELGRIKVLSQTRESDAHLRGFATKED